MRPRRLFPLLATATMSFLVQSVPVEITTSDSALFRGIGLGVTSRAAASEWYDKTLGLKKIAGLPLAGLLSHTPWDEDVNVFPTTKGSVMVLMEWKETPSRSVKDLPVKLQFSVQDPHVTHALITANGGVSANVTGSTIPGALYAKDPDGYLLELVKGDGATYLSSVGVGVANITRTATWWSETTGLKLGDVQRSSAWDTIKLKSTGADIDFMDWHESPKRPTTNLPIKLVISTTSPNSYMTAIEKAGGKVTWNMLAVAFAEDPFEKTLIEINQGLGF